MVVLPADSSDFTFSSVSFSGFLSSRDSKSSRLPMYTLSSPREALIPLPSTASRSFASGISAPSNRSLPSRTTALARGWSLRFSTATAIFNNSSLFISPNGITLVSLGLPSVSVPVLSKASAVSTPRSSKGRPPLMSTPLLAALATPLNTALGVAIAKAQGLAATNTAIAR